jgi:hypothetical protein
METTIHSKDILHKATGNHLDLVKSDQMVLETIRRGRLVLSIRSQESQMSSKKTFRLESTQIRWVS